MPGPAKIESVEALHDVKAMLAVFAEEAGLALVAVDADIARVKHWLLSERPTYWKRRIRELEDSVEASKADIRRKEIVAGNDPVSVVDERKKLRRAQDRLEEARKRAEATRRWGPAWERESMLYKSSCTPLNQAIQADIPRAMARLEKMMSSLEDYLHAESPRTEPSTNDATTPTAASFSEPPPASVGASHDGRTLRDHVPPPESRPSLADRSLLQLPWPAGQPSQTDQESLARLAHSPFAPTTGASLTLAWRATTEPSVFFARTPASHASDTGWYVGPVDAPHVTGGLRVCVAAELLEQHPGLAAILSLPVGSLVVLTRGIVKTVLDTNDRDLWATPTETGT